jgi:hypothetical protein
MFLVRLILILWIILQIDDYLTREWPEFRNGLYARFKKAWIDVSELIEKLDNTGPIQALLDTITANPLDQSRYLELLETKIIPVVEKSTRSHKNFPVFEVERLERF